jgi:hypothetical protein
LNLIVMTMEPDFRRAIREWSLWMVPTVAALLVLLLGEKLFPNAPFWFKGATGDFAARVGRDFDAILAVVSIASLVIAAIISRGKRWREKVSNTVVVTLLLTGLNVCAAVGGCILIAIVRAIP